MVSRNHRESDEDGGPRQKSCGKTKEELEEMHRRGYGGPGNRGGDSGQQRRMAKRFEIVIDFRFEIVIEKYILRGKFVLEH